MGDGGHRGVGVPGWEREPNGGVGPSPFGPAESWRPPDGADVAPPVEGDGWGRSNRLLRALVVTAESVGLIALAVGWTAVGLAVFGRDASNSDVEPGQRLGLVLLLLLVPLVALASPGLYAVGRWAFGRPRGRSLLVSQAAPFILAVLVVLVQRQLVESTPERQGARPVAGATARGATPVS